jgi:hypothetical protein
MMQDPKKAALYKQKKLEVQREFRAKKAAELAEKAAELAAKKAEDEEDYKTASAMRKALKKVEDALPKSKKKAIRIVKELVKKMNKTSSVNIAEQIVQESQLKTIRPRKRFLQTPLLIVNFYESDRISRQLPNKARKGQTQMRELLIPMQEAHKIYIEEHPDKTCSLTYFSQMRPKHIKSFASKKKTEDHKED